jgi:hypothetical protein
VAGGGGAVVAGELLHGSELVVGNGLAEPVAEVAEQLQSLKLAGTASLALKGAGGKASPALATTPSAGGTVGSTTVTDTAKLSGGFSPGGSIEFKLYGPSATAACSGTAVDDETVPVSGDGTCTTPAGVTPTQAGTYWWTASYSGDPNNNTAATNCGDEPVTITSSAHLYWTDLGGGTITGGTVKEANLDGSNQQTIADNQAGPEGVAVSSSNLYWADNGGMIWEANLDGTNAHPLTIPPQPGPVGVAVNSSNIYWADGGSGQIWEASLDGTSPHALTILPESGLGYVAVGPQ